VAIQVVWTKPILEAFLSTAYLTEEEEKILRTQIAGWSRAKQAMTFGMSIGTVDRIIQRLKIKYDRAAEINPTLPKRGKSVKDTFT